MDKRGVSSAATRRRILEAARRSLAVGRNPDLGLNAIARAAGVSRVTIYKQFGSRSGLLEALYDHLAVRGNVRRGKDALLEQEPDAALTGFIRALVGFWSSETAAIRRLHALAALDIGIAKGVAARENRRRRVAAQIVRRWTRTMKRRRHPWTDRFLADTLCVLVSFETYDALARAGHGDEDIIVVMARLAGAVLGAR